MGYMKAAFENWINATPRNNGTPYSKETISGYVSSLRTHTAKLSDLSIENTDLFNYDTLSEFDQIYELIKKSAFFEEINKSYHLIFSSALQMYRRFLMSNTVCEDDYMRQAFETWLARAKDVAWS